jgi:hypothetical protein
MEVTVRLRESKKPGSKVAAFADVVFELPEGRIELNSFAVFTPNGKPAWVAPAASKGEKKFFPHYSIGGQLRKRVDAAILAEYARQADTAAKKS